MSEINRMGAGWFIVKAAIDYGILKPQNIHFGKESSWKTKENTYKRTIHLHSQYIDEILRHWRSNIALIGSGFSNQDLRILALQLQKIMSPQVTDHSNLIEKNTKAWNEFDNDDDLVRYDSNVPENQRVEGLASYLNEIYRLIQDYARDMTSSLFSESGSKFSFEPIPVILRQGHPTHVYETDDKTLARMIDKIKRNNDGSYERILSILEKRKTVLSIVGLYCKTHIVLYYENTSATSIDELREELEMTLAHEYMHYVHNMYVGDKAFSAKTPNRENVIEPIADYFSAMYMAWYRRNVKLVQKRFDFWNEYYGFSIPYVFALDFLNDGNHYPTAFPSTKDSCSIGKYLDVFLESKKDMEMAFRILKNEIGFYNVLDTEIIE